MGRSTGPRFEPRAGTAFSRPALGTALNLIIYMFQSYFGLVVLTMAMNGVGFGFVYSTAIGKFFKMVF